MSIIFLSHTISAESIENNSNFQFKEIKFNLEKNRLPASPLRDKGIEFADVDSYDGLKPLNEDNIGTMESYGNLLRSIHSMRESKSTAAEDVLLNLQKENTYSNCAVGIIAYKYKQIKANALKDNLIKFDNNTVSDNYIDGVWQNPYQERYIFAVAFADTIYDKSLTFDFKEWATNFTGSLQFDAGDGKGLQTVHIGHKLNVTYSSYGTYFPKIIYSNGNYTYKAHTKIVIADANANLGRNDFYGMEWEETCCVVNDKEATLYHCKSGSNKQPFIYVEGFDIPKNNNKKGYGYSCIDNLFYDPAIDKKNGITQGMSMSVLNDYDFYYVDFEDGTATVEDKAELLRYVIQEINRYKRSSAVGNIVFGASMGGLVARYCLRMMEVNNEPHNTTTLICQDTPNLGANVPLGVLYSAHCLFDLYNRNESQYVDLNDEIGKLYKIIHSPAARQVLYNYVDPNGNINNTEHNNFVAKMSQLGYPVGDNGDLRCLAISNGCELITKQDETLLEMNGDLSPSQFADILSGVASIFMGPVVYKYTHDIKAALLSMVPGSNRILLHGEINPTNNLNHPLCHLRIRYKKKLLWTVNAYETIYDYKKYLPSGILFYDLMKGSYYDRSIFSSDESFNARFDFDILKLNVKVSAVSKVLFVPTASALDIGESKTKLTMDDYTTDYIMELRPLKPKHTPFHNYYISKRAEMHISFNDNMNQWLESQLQTKIIGPHIAVSGSKYSLHGGNSSNRVKWSVSDPSIATISPNGVLTVNKHGYITIYAETSNGFVYPMRVMANFPQYKITVNSRLSYFDISFDYIKDKAEDYQMFRKYIRYEVATISKGNSSLNWTTSKNGLLTLSRSVNGTTSIYFRAVYTDENNDELIGQTYYTTVCTADPYIIEPNYIKVQSQSILNDITVKINPNYTYTGSFPDEYKIYYVECHGAKPINAQSGVTTITLNAENLFSQTMINKIISNYNQPAISEYFIIRNKFGESIQKFNVSITR